MDPGEPQAPPDVGSLQRPSCCNYVLQSLIQMNAGSMHYVPGLIWQLLHAALSFSQVGL